MDKIARADATVTLPVSMALNLIDGIRRMHDGWLKALTPEEANGKVTPEIQVVRNLPNHIARAMQDLRDQLDSVEVKNAVPVTLSK